MPASILVADDEEKIAAMVGSYLTASGFVVSLAFDGVQALSLFRASSYDCLILDINMPGMDGLDVAREVRKISAVPIVFLSARSDETDRIVGLELGADDYVPKPFSPRELVARVRAILRRTRPLPPEFHGALSGDEPIRGYGAIVIDVEKRMVQVSGERKKLTAAQFDLLAMLMRSPGRVFSRLELLEASSGSAFEGYERTIDAHVKNIRKALGDDGENPVFIGTVRGVGYKFIERGHEA